MRTTDKSLPTDVDSLTELVLQLQAKLSEQSNYIQQLIDAIQLTRHQHFGTRSEKSNVDQLSLLFNEVEALADYEDASVESDADVLNKEGSGSTKRRRTGGRKKLPDHYPRVEIIYTLEGDDCCCDQCSQPLAPMGEKVSEQIDIIPLTVNVIRHIRKTFHCPNCQTGIKSANLPAQPIAGSIASAGTLAHVAVNKLSMACLCTDKS